MKIKHKLFGLTAIAVIALLIILAINWLANERIQKINHSGADVDQLEITLLNLRRNEKDFMIRKEKKYQTTFTENFNSFQSQLDELITELDELDIDIPELSQLPDNMAQYNKGMTDLVQAYTTLGLTPSEGLLANFSDRFQDLQDEEYDKDTKMTAVFTMLQTGKLLALSQKKDYWEEYQQIFAIQGPKLKYYFGEYFTDYHQAVEQIDRKSVV